MIEKPYKPTLGPVGLAGEAGAEPIIFNATSEIAVFLLPMKAILRAVDWTYIFR